MLPIFALSGAYTVCPMRSCFARMVLASCPGSGRSPALRRSDLLRAGRPLRRGRGLRDG